MTTTNIQTKINETFTKNQVEYKRVEIKGIYQVFQYSLNGFTWYELIKPKLIKCTKIINNGESYYTYPSDEDFGKIAWTYKTLDKIHSKIDELEAHKG